MKIVIKDLLNYNRILLKFSWFFYFALGLLHVRDPSFPCMLVLSVNLFINLESFYAVSIFCDLNEALSAISNGPEGFHIAIVGVMNVHNKVDLNFRFVCLLKIK